MSSTQQSSTSVLCWPKRLLSAEDVRRHVTSQRELMLLPRTVITPLAADELKAKGIRLTWQVPRPKETAAAKQSTWSYAQEKPDVMVMSAVQALQRDGITLVALDFVRPARNVVETMLRAGHVGGIVFCSDPALVCCIANKTSGMRAAAVWSVAQVLRARRTLGANLFAIEMPGRTFFEVRQMLKTIVTGDVECPEEIATTLQELDGHAHR
jgi:ribose 5-phosphate isomerase RpiB